MLQPKYFRDYNLYKIFVQASDKMLSQVFKFFMNFFEI